MTTAADMRVKGPLVFGGMDQAELDDAYDQQKWVTNAKQVMERVEAACNETRARLGEPLRFAYGPSPVEGLDVFPARQPNAPIAISIHGGGWRQGEARSYAAPAEMLVNAGAALVIPDFATAAMADGDLGLLAAQVRRAVAFVYSNARSFGGDPDRIYVFGHSSGGHLAGVIAITDWQQDFGLDRSPVKGAMLSSGLYELEPVRYSKRSSYVSFTDAMVEALSTQRHIARIVCPVTVLYCTNDSPEFQRQAREFVAAMQAAGKPVELRVGVALNHFEAIETFTNPFGFGGRALLDLMGLHPAQ